MIRFSREKVLLLHQLLTEETGVSVGRARNNPVNRVNLAQNSSRRSNDRQMSLLPKQIAWTEPWSVEYVKERLRQCRKELPSPWRMAAYCVVLPTVVMSVAKAFLPTLEWGTVLRVILVLPAAFFAIPFLTSVFPTCIHILASGITFQVGNTCSHIDIKNIAALSFETHDGRRYFVVHAANSKGIPYERRALLPPRNVTKPGIVTEQDIIGFLYEMNLGHLIKETCEEEGAKGAE